MPTISPEALMPQMDGRWTDANVGEAWAQAHRLLRSSLADPDIREVRVMVGCPGSGKSTWAAAQPDDASVVVFDAVFADPKRRSAIAKRITGACKRAVAVVVTSPLALCLERNDARPAWRRVPEAFVRRTWGELQRWPVAASEGWTEVRWVDGTARAV